MRKSSSVPLIPQHKCTTSCAWIMQRSQTRWIQKSWRRPPTRYDSDKSDNRHKADARGPTSCGWEISNIDRGHIRVCWGEMSDANVATSSRPGNGRRVDDRGSRRMTRKTPPDFESSHALTCKESRPRGRPLNVRQSRTTTKTNNRNDLRCNTCTKITHTLILLFK